MSASAGFVGGSRSAVSAWNDDTCRVGISSAESIARMTSRIASVATTRTIPRRAASWVAIVDLPTPVAPPIRITSGTSSVSHLPPADEVLRVAVARDLADHLERDARASSSLT